MVRIKLRLCVGEEVRPRKGVGARRWWSPRQSGEPFKLNVISARVGWRKELEYAHSSSRRHVLRFGEEFA